MSVAVMCVRCVCVCVRVAVRDEVCVECVWQ